MAWDAKAIVVNDRKFKGKGNRATGDEFAAAPNIDHMQDYVRKDLTDWLEWLRDDIGFDGWRYYSPAIKRNEGPPVFLGLCFVHSCSILAPCFSMVRLL